MNGNDDETNLILGSSDKVRRGAKGFYPGYFALVMATGIISSACLQLHYERLGKFLFILNNVQYGILLLIFFVHLLFYIPKFKENLANHSKGAGYLTLVASSCILGMGYLQSKAMFTPAMFLFSFSFLAWLILIYAFLSLCILAHNKPSLEKGLNGSWLLLIVSTQSLVILGTSLGPYLQVPMEVILFTTVAGWLLGILLYILFVTIIIYRLTFYTLNPSELSPSYWVDTGAAAITTLAGSTLSASLESVVEYQKYIPVINLLSLLAWSAATFWLPMLFILETWRHIKAGFKYSPDYWSLVFPLGMHSVATLKLATIFQMHYLHFIAKGFLYIALLTWLIVFIGMLAKIKASFSKHKSHGIPQKT